MDLTTASNTDMPCSTSIDLDRVGPLLGDAAPEFDELGVEHVEARRCRMISSGGAVTGPVGAAVETGTKRKRDRLGFENSASPLVPNSVKLSVVAVATEQNSSPVAPFLKRSMMVVVSSDGLPGM